jgi:hypothetical protein
MWVHKSDASFLKEDCEIFYFILYIDDQISRKQTYFKSHANNHYNKIVNHTDRTIRP